MERKDWPDPAPAMEGLRGGTPPALLCNKKGSMTTQHQKITISCSSTKRHNDTERDRETERQRERQRSFQFLHTSKSSPNKTDNLKKREMSKSKHP
jgi:F0F1-type ATP synthase epsilon subunit